MWAECTVFPWLYPAARGHLAAGPLAAAGLAAGAAWLYGGMYLAGFALVYGWLPRPRWLTATALWVIGEWVRGAMLGGAPWALLGHALHACLPLAQLAELTGVAGLTVLALVPAVALAESGAERRSGLAAWALAVAAAAWFGTARLAAPAEETTDGTPAILVVGGRNAAPDPLLAYLDATADAPPARVTIWPEGSMPRYLQEEPGSALALGLAAQTRGWLLLGTRRYTPADGERRYFNSAILLDPGGTLHATYDKTRLVPFAERSPWPFPSLIERPFTAGPSRPKPLDAGGLRLGVLVCWESVFAEPARSYAREGVDVLVNLTSDRDLGAGVSQLVAFSRLRAIETRRWLARASGLGPTLQIDPRGHVHRRDTLPIPTGTHAPPTFYVRHGEVVPYGALLLLALSVGLRTLRRTGVRTRGRGAF